MLHNWIQGLVFAVVVLGAAWLVRSYRLSLELRDHAVAAASSTHAAVNLRATLRSISGDDYAKPTTKPWLDDLAAYAQMHGGRWIVGESRVACASESEAIAVAREDAARQIGALVVNPDLTPQELEWVGRRIAMDVRNGQLQADSTTEQFERPYGTVWVGSVLVDASPERIFPLVGAYSFEARRRVFYIVAARVGAVALAALVWLAYFPINWLTKGFFARRLRFGAVMMTAAAVLFLV